MIAKMRGGARKRRHDEDEDGMDVDVDGDDDDAWSDDDGGQGGGKTDTMEIDGEDDDDDTPRKRGKANSGAVIARKRAPHSNRQLAGLRDEAVRFEEFFFFSSRIYISFANTDICPLCSLSKLPRPYGCEISASVGATCSQKRARATGLSESKWCVYFIFFPLYLGAPLPAFAVSLSHRR